LYSRLNNKKMKILFSIIVCLYSLGTYAQDADENEVDGIFIFDKAELSIHNYDTKGLVDARIIDDATKIDSTDFHSGSILLEAKIYNGDLVSCQLLNKRTYIVQNKFELIPFGWEDIPHDDIVVREDGPKAIPLSVPPYSFSVDGDRLTIDYRYQYGDSSYDFPLEGRLTVTLIKQKR